MCKNLFCLIGKSQGVSFNKAIEELKLNFKIIHNVISDKHVESLIKYEYKPQKVQCQLTNLIVYDIETFDIDRALPCANGIFRLSKISGKYNRDITDREYEKYREGCIVFQGTDNFIEILHHVLQSKGEVKKVKVYLLNAIYTY